MRASRVFLAIIGAAAVASCTEANPNACANDPSVCGAGTMCIQGKDSNGQSWSRCAPIRVGDGGSAADQAREPAEDAANSGPDSSTVVAADAGADVRGQAPPPDALAADAPALDALAPDARAGDAPIGCTNQCSLGSRRCGNRGGTQDCVMMGACTMWTAEVVCATPRMCEQSGPSVSCTCPSVCTQGAQRCGPGGGVQPCGVGPTGCPAWSGESACQPPMVCRQSGGGASCECPMPAACRVGVKQCGATGVRECLMVNGCPGWGREAACPSPRTCQQGGDSATCICPAATCTSGAQQCSPGGGIRQCVSMDGCLLWGADSPCPAPKTCQVQGPNSSCECPAATHMECSGAVCGLRIWNFESGSLEGATVDPKSDVHNVVLSQPLRVERAPGGSRAIGASLLTGPGQGGSQFASFDFIIPLCGQDQTATVYQKGFSSRIYIQSDRPPSATENVEVNLSPHIEPYKPAPFDSWFTFQGVFASPGIPVSLYSGVRALRFSFLLRVESPWTLTIWIDDVQIDR